MGRNRAKAFRRFSSPSVALAPASCGYWQNLSSTFRLSMMATYKIEHEDGITLLPAVYAMPNGRLVSEVRWHLDKSGGHLGLLLRNDGTHLTLLSNDDRLNEQCTYTFQPFSPPAPHDLKEFLNQKLPIVKFHFKPPNQSRPHRLWPLGVLEWVGVDTQIHEFVDSQSGNYRLTGESIVFGIPDRAREADLLRQMHNMILVIGRSLFSKYSGFSICLEQVGSSSILEIDGLGDAGNLAVLLAEGLRKRINIVSKLGSNPIFVVEIKGPSAFRANSRQRAPSLVQDYRDSSIAASKPDGSPANSAVCAVQQLYGYLDKLALNFGIISSLDLTYLVQRDGLQLLILEPIAWDSGNLVAALGFLIHLAARAQAQATTSHVGFASGLDSMGDGHHGNTRDSKDDGGGRGGTATTKPWSSEGFHGWQETATENLCLRSDFLVGEGWSGFIAQGTYEGHPVAVKLAPVYSGRAEVMAYYKLEKHWGKYVPILRSYGTTACGSIVYVATELIEGFPLGTEALTNDVLEALFAALHVIHSFGIQHGDIRKDNIMVPKGGQSGVRFIDFGFAHAIVDSEDCKKEQAQLQEIIDKCFLSRLDVQAVCPRMNFSN